MRSPLVSSGSTGKPTREAAVLFVGDDWAEAHHDVEVVDEQGRRLARGRLPEGIEGIGRLHALIADHLLDDAEPEQVVVGIETDRGPWVPALLAAGYTVYAINPLQAARYRERHSTSGAKSDPGDAHVLAELVRTDRAHHRPIAGDSDLADAVKAARAHQSLIWARQRQVNALPLFGQHPDAEIVLSQPGLGPVLGARVLAEFGTTRTDTATPEHARTTAAPAPSPAPAAPDASSWPATPATGTWPTRSTCRPSRPHQLTWRAQLLRRTPRPRRHPPPSPARLANRLVGILHGCLRHHSTYDEATAGRRRTRHSTPPLDALQPWDV